MITTNSENRKDKAIPGLPTVEEHPCTYGLLKRCLDILVSSILLLLFLPIFVLLYALVKLTSEGPALYKSQRVGLCGKPFLFLKFRSMYVDAEARRAELLKENEKGGPIFKIKHDPRITPIGRLMRKYSLDELPQILHVFTGEMTLVGPRPPLPHEVHDYDDLSMRRLSVKPGITCYWQIMGRSDLSFEEWMELDARYIDEMSFWTDLKILARTPVAVLRGRGAY